MKRRDPLFWIGVVFLAALVLMATFGTNAGGGWAKQSESIFAGPSAKNWLGTDELGRDIFARLAYGAQVSLKIGLIVQAIALVFGIFVGTVGVFAPKWISGPLMRFTDAMFAFPDILLAMLIIGIWSQGMIPVIVALSITSWPSVARLVKTQLASIKDREYVVAARAAGAPTSYVVIKHVLPQLMGTLLAVSMVDLAGTILAESTLSFLGIGVQPPEPSWGTMINGARQVMQSHPMILFWPCLILGMTIFALNFVGDGLRSRLDPRSQSR